MKTVLMSSALALMIAPAAFADEMAVVDFNEDGIVSEADFIGSKTKLAAMSAAAAAPQVVTRQVTREVVVPGTASADVVDISTLAPSGDNYVSIGAYQGGTMGTLEVAPATTQVVTETQVVVTPAAGLTEADVYPDPHGNFDAAVPASLIGDPIYQPPVGADATITMAEMGMMDDQYVDDRLAAFDTNKDGQVTTSEAIANLDPQIDPNVAAFHGGVNSPEFLEEQHGGSRRSD